MKVQIEIPNKILKLTATMLAMETNLEDSERIIDQAVNRCENEIIELRSECLAATGQKNEFQVAIAAAAIAQMIMEEEKE